MYLTHTLYPSLLFITTMAPVRNARVIYKSHPSTYLVPGETTQYDASQTIDIDNVPLNGGEFILQSIAVSSDPVIRLRMHAPEFKGFLPPFKIGERYEFRTSSPAIDFDSREAWRVSESAESSAARTRNIPMALCCMGY